MPNIANKHETYMELKKTNRKWERNELFSVKTYVMLTSLQIHKLKQKKKTKKMLN